MNELRAPQRLGEPPPRRAGALPRPRSSRPSPPGPAQGRALQAGAPLAAINWESFAPGTIAKTFKSFKDKVYYGDVLPPVGSQTISYARFLHLLSTRMVRPPAARPALRARDRACSSCTG